VQNCSPGTVAPDVFLELAPPPGCFQRKYVERLREANMNGIIYLVGLVVVIMAVLSLLGLR
jgi:hypothetical protein